VGGQDGVVVIKGGSMNHSADVAVQLVVCGLAFWAIWGLILIIGTWQCQAKWGRSGMATEFGVLSGCQIKRADGTWIPADSYREVMN